MKLPHHRKSKHYYEYGYKPRSIKNKHCALCRLSELIKGRYHCEVLKSKVTPVYVCNHFSKRPARVNKVVNVKEYARVQGIKLRAKDKTRLQDSKKTTLNNECICIKSLDIKYSTEGVNHTLKIKDGKIYYYKDTNTNIPSRLIFKILHGEPSFLFKIENFNKYFKEV